jgi:hypothetical protein
MNTNSTGDPESIGKKVLGGTADNKTPLTGSASINAINTTCSNPINVIGNINIGTSTSTTNGVDQMYYGKNLVNAIVTLETVELHYIRRAKFTYTTNSFGYQQYNADLAIKEIYGCQDGKLTLLKTVNGKVKPPYQVEEELVFDDEIEE